jgi:hypothetical protein
MSIRYPAMRFLKSNRRLVIYVSDRQVEPIVLAAVRVIVPRYSRKLYFLGFTRVYPKLERLAEERAEFTMVRFDSVPSNFIRTFRMEHLDKKLIIVPGGNSRLAPQDWERVIAEVAKAA